MVRGSDDGVEREAGGSSTGVSMSVHLGTETGSRVRRSDSEMELTPGCVEDSDSTLGKISLWTEWKSVSVCEKEGRI